MDTTLLGKEINLINGPMVPPKEVAAISCHLGFFF